jgi:hypothetical protein
VGGASGVVPCEWTGSNNFILSESEFYTLDKTGPARPESLNMVAAGLIHEFLIHSRQFNHGQATADALGTDLNDVEFLLSEIVAYTVSLQDPFYQVVLTPEQRTAIGTKELNDKIGDFKKAWATLTPPLKQRAATYAWYCSNYMKSNMSRASLGIVGPGSLALLGIVPARSLQATPWTELCTAIPSGVGMCHVADKKPDDPECLKNPLPYF